MSKKSKKIPYKELLKNCKSLHGANLLLATLLVRKLKKKNKLRGRAEILCCRTCLGTDQLEPIFGEEVDEKRSSDLLQVTGIEVKYW